MLEIHDRMSVILSQEEIGKWITQPKFVNEALFRVPQELLRKRVG